MTAATFDIKANDKTKAAFASVSKKLKRLSTVAGKATLALAAVSGTALTGLTLASARSADALAKQADKIGITTEKLASLHYMTEQYTNAGVGAMSEALTKAEKRLGEFVRTGGGAAATWLKTLNLDVAHLKSLSPDELFETYAGAISGLNSRGEQLAATSALMGDESRALMNIIDAGPAAFRNAEIEAKAFGLTLSRIEIAKIEAAGDAIDKVQQVFKGVGNKLAVKFSVYIEEIANRFNDAAVSSNGFVDVIEGGMKTATMSVAYLGDVIHGLNVVWEIVELTFKGFAAGLFNTLDLLQQNIVSVINLMPGIDIEPIQTLSAITREANEEFNKTKDALAALVEQPMPSEKIEEFFAVIEEKSTRAAEKVAALAGGSTGEGGNADDIARKEKAEQLELQHQAKLGSIEAKGAIFREKFRKMSAKNKAKSIFGEMAMVTQGVAQSNKTMFEINKVSAIANAGMNAYEGISLTLSKYPYPFNIGLAALHGVAAFAQISAIKKTSFQGGGGGTTPSLAGSSGTVNNIPVASAPANQEQQTSQPTQVTLNIDDDIILSGAAVKRLWEQADELRENGAIA